MTTADHGKRISAVWIEGDGNAYNESIRAVGDITIELSATYHGDRDEFWILVKKSGVELRRLNPRYVSEIDWEKVSIPMQRLQCEACGWIDEFESDTINREGSTEGFCDDCGTERIFEPED